MDRLHADRRIRRRHTAVRRATARQRGHGGGLKSDVVAEPAGCLLSFHLDNFNYAAAISIDLLVVALICAAVILMRTGLFKVGH